MKILIVTANFAPRGASPAIRVVHMVKYLERAGNQVRVITYDEAALLLFSPLDPSLSLKVPENAVVKRISPGPLRRRLVKKSGGEPGGGVDLKKKSKKSVLLPLLIPDPHVDAVPGFYREAARQIEESVPDALITYGYPFSLHLVGALLKRKYPNLFWVADYGDPWTGSPISELPRPRWRKYLDRKMEKVLLGYADLISVTTENTRALYETNFPFLKGKVTVVPMGFDPDDFHNLQIEQRSPEEGNQLWLVHPGRIYSDARDPLPFVNALGELIRKHPQAREVVRVFLVGEVEGSLREKMENVLPHEVLVFIPWVTHEESLRWMMRADYLLLFGNRGIIQIPGKIYQYLGSGKPVIMLNMSDEDPALSIISIIKGSVIVKNEGEKIFRQLEEICFKRGNMAIARESDSANEYSWETLAWNLLKEIQRKKAELVLIR